MAHLKKLHIGTNLQDLEKHCAIPDVTNKNMKLLLNTAKKLYLTAEEQRLDGDEELAYVTYMKYFNLLSCIHKKPEYAEHKETVRQMLGNTQANRRIMDKLERLSDSLSQRYEQQSKSGGGTLLTLHDASIKSELNSITTNTTTTKHAVASQPTMPPTQHDLIQLSLISCQQLFERMQQKNVLIMDCRTRNDYDSSHLTYGWAFNVPDELICTGMSAGKLQGKLSSEAKAMWAARSIKDHVVLVDWNTKDAQPAPNTTIAVLLDILKRWDPDVTYRSPIQILDGGYEYFIMMYPTLCTNPSVQAPMQNNNEIETIDDIEYPSIHDITMKDELRQSDFSLTPEKSALPAGNNAASSHSKTRPSIDRASKQAALRIYEEKCKPITEIAQEQDSLLQKAQANDELLEQAAKKWETIVELKHLSAEGKKLSDSDQQLLYNIMQLESRAEDYKIENNRLRDELQLYKQQEHMHQQPLSPKEVEVSKQIETRIQQREILDAQHERQRVECERLLAIARDAKRLYRPPSAATSPIDNVTQQQQQQQEQSVHDKAEDDSQPAESQPTTNGQRSAANGKEDFIIPPEYSDVDVDVEYEDEENDKENARQSYAQRPQFDRAMKPKNIITQHENSSNNNHTTEKQRVTQKQRDFSPVSSGNKGRGLTGLKNLGNTCYMNSILQCLSNTPQLTEYCITDKYKSYISRSNKTKGHIVEEVAALIKILWNGNYKCVASKDLRYVIGQYQQIFRGVEQQDSHEFLTILMDWLHSDLQTLYVPPRMRENISASEKAWLEFTKSKESLILHLFYGQIKSTVKCVTCNKESATYECFSNLSLELPSNENVCYLSQCMDMYFSGELIHGWNCPNCKQKRDAIKKLDISKLPPVLVVHLKRFYADTDAAGNAYKKKQNYVRFPLENLDMNPYIAKAESRSVTPKTYQLYGVSNHYGSMEAGHYTAFCKSANYGRWFKFDDQAVTTLDSSYVVSSAAYILFYTWLPPIQISECN